MRLITEEIDIERKTYLKGRFIGRFIGYLDPQKSDMSHEFFYNLKIEEGKIFVKEGELNTWDKGEHEEFKDTSEIPTRLPGEVKLELIGSEDDSEYYWVNLQGCKMTNIRLTNQVYDQNVVLGEIESDFSGFITHFEKETIYHEIEDKPLPQITLASSIDSKISQKKTGNATGKIERNGSYFRKQYYNSDGTTYWGAWQYQAGSFWSGLLSGIGWVLTLALLIFILIPLLMYGWKLLLIIAVIYGAFWLIPNITGVAVNLFGWLARGLAILFLLALVVGVINTFTNSKSPFPSPLPPVTDTSPTPNPIPVDFIENTDPVNEDDHLIGHQLTWYDYNQNQYTSTLSVSSSALSSSSLNRNSFLKRLNSGQIYNELLYVLYTNDFAKLGRVYDAFDQLREENGLSGYQFAEVLISCIQYLPYNLVLNGPCQAEYYPTGYIKEYLNEGGPCVPNVKHGILAPIEYVANLKGDCDTRTLLGFTLLNHYGYDVAILGSDVYSHSVLAINGPYSGVYKRINGKKYYMWETTAAQLQPGTMSREWSNPNYWNVNLIAKNLNL